MSKVTGSKRSVLASVALVGLSGCLTVNNIPTKDEPAVGPDGSTVVPDGGGPGGGGSEAGINNGAPDPDAAVPRQACEDLPDVEENGIPLRGIKDYCPEGQACDAEGWCVPMQPCSPTSPAACSLEELVDHAILDQTNGLFYEPSVALDDTYVYFTRFGTYGALNEYNKDGAILRAKIGVWEPEVIHDNLMAPNDLHINGDGLFLSQGDAYYWASKDGALPPLKVMDTGGRANRAVSFGNTILFPASVTTSNGPRCVIKAVLTSGAALTDFSGPYQYCYPSLFATPGIGTYLVNTNGHFRIDSTTGAVTSLPSTPDPIVGLVGDRWVSLQSNTWVTRRGVEETGPTRVGGIGTPVLTERDSKGSVAQVRIGTKYAVFISTSKTITPRTPQDRVVIAVPLAGGSEQQIIDPYVPASGYSSLRLGAASDTGVILSNAMPNMVYRPL